jgi:hypothetical protein
MTIAQTILAQLGGNRFLAMTGATNLMNTERGLRFRFPGCRDMNICEITLDEDDTYSLTFFRARGLDCPITAEYWGIYNSQLRGLFERKTGLATAL